MKKICLSISLLILCANLAGCGGGLDSGSNLHYFFEYYKTPTSTAVYGPYPSLAECNTARARFPSYFTTQCHS